MSPGCDNAQLVSALNNEDQGTQNVITSLFNIPDADLVNAAFGYQNTDNNASDAKVPPVGTGSNYGIQACLARCAKENGGSAPKDTYGVPSASSFDYGQ